MRAMSCAGAGILLAAVAALVAACLACDAVDRIGRGSSVPHQLILPTLANAIVIMSAYLAAASLVWGFADASMDQPLDLEAFDAAPSAVASGASRICPTSISSASAMAFASRAGGAGRAATSG